MSNPAPGRQACQTVTGEPVYVTIAGRLPDQTEFISVGVRDAEEPDTGTITRGEFREVIDMAPVDALHLASILIDFALLAM